MILSSLACGSFHVDVNPSIRYAAVVLGCAVLCWWARLVKVTFPYCLLAHAQRVDSSPLPCILGLPSDKAVEVWEAVKRFNSYVVRSPHPLSVAMCLCSFIKC